MTRDDVIASLMQGTRGAVSGANAAVNQMGVPRQATTAMLLPSILGTLDSENAEDVLRLRGAQTAADIARANMLTRAQIAAHRKQQRAYEEAARRGGMAQTVGTIGSLAATVIPMLFGVPPKPA